MLAAERRSRILGEVDDLGVVRITQLAEDLAVSDMTIRRDLTALAARGLVRKVHGGAVAPHLSAHERHAAHRDAVTAEREQGVAEAAAGLVAPGSSIAIGAGRTATLLAVHIAATPSLRPLTVTTNSLPIAEALHRSNDPRLTTIVTGGTRLGSGTLVGPLAASAFAHLPMSMAFIDVAGISTTHGLSARTADDAAASRSLVGSAARSVILAERSKWGANGSAWFATLAEVDAIVTDFVPPDQKRRLYDLSAQIVLA
ncbi:DeoR/GlpR family transcriptional regulator of sugar metabolism [Cellulosimicrobium cellulans]|uniref:DeoR/GlpR family DNA-binding transcription regulator n=1 Tax=Cellulosimicrobium cellulans TaxID=1710 RepID=UPI00195D82C4|nr:DeoR/GlpR family DNA-binding transcription regulator [Cellulosimicrobium cellulans]MBM7818736.1 DeoR/GlpR family transcriptional regulator of sugar metabolism [Cellulosimicrobium cellulans]